ncbi:MAG: FtsQ-type POTRA domain-containing protein [Dysosmobacter sp.]
MARRRGSARRRRRGGSGFLYKLLSVFLICGCLVAAITLFFRVDTVVITGEKRYTEAEIRQASGVEDGDNLFC